MSYKFEHLEHAPQSGEVDALLLMQGARKRPCESEGCESGKTWTRPVMGIDRKHIYLCTWCLSRLDNAGRLKEL